MKKVILVIVGILLIIGLSILLMPKLEQEEEIPIEELKEEFNATGADEIYEVQTEYDGRKVLAVKPSINYRVAFAGMIKKAKPEYSEVDKIYEENMPTENGIWIEKSSRDKILKLLNNNSNDKYEITDDGYLKCNKKIKGDKQYILCISGENYMVDTLNGDIVINPFEDLDSHQSYNYVKDNNKMIIFITNNLKKKLTDKEIVEDMLSLLE